MDYLQFLDFSDKISFYEQFGHVENYGDGNQCDFCHPFFEIVKNDLEEKTSLKLRISSGRFIYNLSDVDAQEWHLDGENPQDLNTAYTLLLYFNSMNADNGGCLEFTDHSVIPLKGMGLLIHNENINSRHRATPMNDFAPRKVLKLTFFRAE